MHPGNNLEFVLSFDGPGRAGAAAKLELGLNNFEKWNRAQGSAHCWTHL